jgi:hypothetical protein
VAEVVLVRTKLELAAETDSVLVLEELPCLVLVLVKAAVTV